VTALTLSRLDAVEIRAMVARLGPQSPLTDAVVAQIVIKTDGIPLFVEELTKAVLETTTPAAATNAVLPGVPATLRDSLMARLDRLPRAKEVAQIAACIGREFNYTLLAALCPLPEPNLKAAIHDLMASELIFDRGQAEDASYVFKHALIQEAAYDSLLKTTRRALHADIAEALQTLFPELATTQPELVAQHYAAAQQSEHATAFWRKAGELSLRKLALTEAIAHLHNGLEEAAKLPPAQAHPLVVDLHVLLGTAWIAKNGWHNQNVYTHLAAALDLAEGLGRSDILPAAYSGITMNVLTNGRIAEAQGWADRCLSVSERTGDRDLRIIAHDIGLVTRFWLGDLVLAREHGNQLLALCTAADAPRIATLTNHDPITIAGIYASHWTWMLGFPDTAVKISDEKDDYARREGHPFDVCFALGLGALVFDYRGELDRLLERTAECRALGREHGLVFMEQWHAPLMENFALLHGVDTRRGIAVLSTMFDHPMNAQVLRPYQRTALAEGLIAEGRLDEALASVNGALEQIERPGWSERSHYAEALRVKATILILQKHRSEAETCLQASLAVARAQQAKSWELRTATTYARLLTAQGRNVQALELLQPVYEWFTEGRSTKDHVEARTLLEELTGLVL
jgi:tetratricopeptide (TPR) repeat protein